MDKAERHEAEGLHIRIEGSVQGVGFRPWVHGLARSATLRGRVWNEAGAVRIDVFGEPALLARFLDDLEHPPMPAARVRDLRWEAIPDEPIASFDIVASRTADARHPAIPPDLALCGDCRREMLDSADRRYRYPFINCTACGPRFTICRDVPYDRAATTMASFPMCPSCRAEYEDPGDRRYHAQPVACPECGPRLVLLGGDGQRLAEGDEALMRAATMLCEGSIVAVKGLGGFHLACDAHDPEAVGRLRARKHRDAKPFAVMMATLTDVEQELVLGEAERALLCTPARPIVLARRRAGSTLPPGLAPDNPLVGVMLPYTPLHELLLRAAGRALVMTSGNRSDEPMVTEDADALVRLAGAIADVVLTHDRDIASRCDDSVVRVVAGRPTMHRLGRGWVPQSVGLASASPLPLLACGAHLKNSFCYLEDDRAWIGPHVGDLETHEACVDFEDMVERFGHFVGVSPEAVACDLHPDYHSSRWARELADRQGLPLIRVQHHHAHLASVMAEHGIEGPVFGLAWDGTGYGTDGTAWGGELLLADYAGYRRVATFRPLALAGGDLAIAEVWRIALAALDDAFEGEPPLARLALFGDVEPARVALVRQMVASNLRTPRARGVGRWFDVVGALVLARGQSRFEGDVAMQLAFAVGDLDVRRTPAYDYDLDDSRKVPEVDLRPTLRAIVGDLLAERDPAWIAARFHATLAAAAADMLHGVQACARGVPVVVTGGCFHNEHLLIALEHALGPQCGFLTQRDLPPGDGGIALGQAAVAAAVLRGDSGPHSECERPRISGPWPVSLHDDPPEDC